MVLPRILYHSSDFTLKTTIILKKSVIKRVIYYKHCNFINILSTVVNIFRSYFPRMKFFLNNDYSLAIQKFIQWSWERFAVICVVWRQKK